MCDMTLAPTLIYCEIPKLLDNRLDNSGTSKLDWACFLTGNPKTIKRACNPTTVSYDSASAFVATAHGLVYSCPLTRMVLYYGQPFDEVSKTS